MLVLLDNIQKIKICDKSSVGDVALCTAGFGTLVIRCLSRALFPT